MGRPFFYLGPRALGFVKAKGLPGRRICLGKCCLGGEYAWENHVSSWVFAPLVVARRDKRRLKQYKEPGDKKGAHCPFTPSPSFLLFPWPAEDRTECVCAGSRLTRAAGVTWPGHVQAAPFLPQQLAHKQAGCCGSGGRDMCKRGGGARGPARAKGRRSLSTASPLPTLALLHHRKFLVLLCCCKTCFWEVTFNKDGVNGLFKKRQDG